MAARFSLFSGASLSHPLTGLAALFPEYWGPYPFKTSKKHSPQQNNNNNKKKKMATCFSFVLRHWPPVPAHHSCCPVSLVARAPHLHCVCAVVRITGAGCSAVLGFFSLPLRPLYSRPELGGGVLRTRRAGACILPPLRGAGFLQVSSGLYFRKSCLCYIFIDICGFGRRFLLLYSCRHPVSATANIFLSNFTK